MPRHALTSLLPYSAHHTAAHAHINNIRPIPTPNWSISYNCVPLSPHQPIKLENVPDSTQCGEARRKVIPEETIRVGRWGRSCEHRIAMLLDIIHNTAHLIHLDHILWIMRNPCYWSSTFFLNLLHWPSTPTSTRYVSIVFIFIFIFMIYM